MTQLEELTAVLEKKLLEGDASDVASLVVGQCDCLRLLSGVVLTGSDLDRLFVIKDKVVTQQKLVEQALQVTEHFLSNLSQQNSFTYEG
ncbi:hypothetical protein GI364_19860 [Alicyclobacillus sp. SO9]|nr:hypothetical protein GI364_19860 [Alicyclobacillus sp. SO9]